MTFATFILSTGRCGTQWIASTLKDVYSNSLHVEHEPLHNRYAARKVLGWYCFDNASLTLSQDVQSHLNKIETVLETKSYIECGHPNWSLIPYLASQFEGRIRIIHLTRHPVPTSCSWLTHQAYQPPLLPHLEEKILLSPFDQGVQFSRYQKIWESLQPFEKCLYYWAEVNQYALHQEKRLDVPWLRISYENLFHGDGLNTFVRFLELPFEETLLNYQTHVVDRFRYLSPVWQDWKIIKNHPDIMRVAGALGYSLEEVDNDILMARYFM